MLDGLDDAGHVVILVVDLLNRTLEQSSMQLYTAPARLNMA